MHSTGLYIGLRQELLKLAPQSMETVWKVKCRDWVPSFVQGSTLLVGSSEGWHGLSAEDGSHLWGPQPFGVCRPWRDGVVGFRPLARVDPETGTIERQLQIAADLRGEASICGDTAVGSSISGNTGDPTTAVDLVSEQILWQRNLVADTQSLMGPQEATFFVSADACLLASRRDGLAGFSLADGTGIWHRRLQVPYARPNVADGRVYVLSGGEGYPACLHCLNLRDGSTAYEVPQPLLRGTEKPFPGSISGEHIVFGAGHDLVVSFRTTDGKAMWWYRDKRGGLTTPLLVGDMAIVPAFNGRLLLFADVL